MDYIIQGIGAICCAIVMGIAALLGMNYLETNIWWFYVLEPLLIIIFMGGCLCKAVSARKDWVSGIAFLLFAVSAVTTGLLTKKAFDYGEQISASAALSGNQWAVNSWNAYTPDMLHVNPPTETTVGEAGILILRKYGEDLYHIGYFELNLILYAFLFPGIALYFAILWRKRKYQTAIYSAIPICIGTLLMAAYLFKTLPVSLKFSLYLTNG